MATTFPKSMDIGVVKALNFEGDGPSSNPGEGLHVQNN